ncbi:MAG: hypothetical protein BZ138_01900 [Methanosphaera sp. rholeuAM270]|nr:MAG: hypothetical protein BZ138_01900 [Methanosphaera sp. rholeuAM270]
MDKYVPDYYKILGIDKNASKKTVKKAYKRLAKKYDPETSGKKNAATKYKFVKDAYIVLSDDKKRAKYDKILKDAENKRKYEEHKKETVNTKDVINTVKDNSDIISKLFKTGTKAMKGKSLFTGTNLLIGGAMAGYGIKKGRDYMANRGRKNR